MGNWLPKLALLQPAPLRKRLWQAAGAMAVFVGSFVIGNFFISPDKSVTREMLGHDFLAFYTAGTFARTGHSEKLYDLDATRDFEHALAAQNHLEIGQSFAPYWNPPFFAWLVAPLSLLPYPAALSIWRLGNILCLLGAIYLLANMLPHALRDDWRNWGLVPLLICVSMPFIQASGHGQNTFMSLLLLASVVTLWRRQKPILAGLVCGLMFYKPQLAAVVAGMLALSLGWRVLIGLAATGGALLLLTVWSMPHMIAVYLHQLPLNLTFMQIDQVYLWERHVTLKAFWRLLFQGRAAGETGLLVTVLTVLSCAVIGVGLIGAWWRSRNNEPDDCWTGQTRSLARDRLIVAVITSMPLLMPFYFDYDLLLLSVPVVLLAGEILGRTVGTPIDRSQRLLVGIWIGMYLWLMVNPPIAGASCVNVTVVMLTSVAVVSIIRVGKVTASPAPVILPKPLHIPLRRAA